MTKNEIGAMLTCDSESRAPHPSKEDTSIPDDVVDAVEGTGYHPCVDKFGKMHIIKSPKLDILKNWTQLAAQNASQYYLLAENASHRKIAFGICSLALFGVTSAQYFLAGTFDKIDFALALATFGAALVSKYQANNYLDMMTDFSNANDVYNKEYQTTLYDLAHKDCDDEDLSMFR